ncbi:MAG: MBL fold metallo-hydrolase [Pseudomonadota bacterium]
MALDGFTPEPAVFENVTTKRSFKTSEIAQGINEFEDFFVYRTGDQITGYDRVCDHNAGRLLSKSGVIKCPLHGWELDPATGRYSNVDCDKKPLFKHVLSDITSEVYTFETSQAKRALHGFSTRSEVSIRYLNHACLIIETESLRIGTDPWIEGPAFCNGWWLAAPSPMDSYDALNACDMLFISHNHPDHLHPVSLSNIRKEMPILTPAFGTGSTVRYLRDLGFEDITEGGFTERFTHHNHEIAVSVLKSGDFRDDGGLLLEVGEFSMVASVDSNFIDFWRYPDGLTLLAHSFAGGASGFPLCFDNFTEEEKERLLTRNRNSVRAINRRSFEAAHPKAFLPYAGFFKESAERDAYIQSRNRKNGVRDYAKDCADLGITLIDVTETDMARFRGNELLGVSSSQSPRRAPDDIAAYIAKTAVIYDDMPRSAIATYFENSAFRKDLALRVTLTGPDFDTVEEDVFVDFFDAADPVVSFEAPTTRETRTLNITVRAPEFRQVLSQGLPWEDLSIGFQCRITREPNVYNSDFWYHFTNVYVNDAVKTRSEDCSSCVRIDQALV